MDGLNFKLHAKQREIFESKARFKVIAAGRRGGKSFLSAIMLVVKCLLLENDSGYNLQNKQVWYIAPTYGQAKDIMWSLLKDIARPVTKKVQEKELTITLINDRQIVLKGADRPDTLRGVGLSYLVFDEYAFIKPEVWDLILRATLADVRGEAMFISTPDGKNHFYDLYLGAQEWEDWEAFTFCSLDNPMIDPKEIEVARNTLSTSAFRQEFEASFSSGGGTAFKEEQVRYEEEYNEEGYYYITVDPASFEESESMVKNKRLDECAICVVKVCNNGTWFVEDVIHGRWTVRETAVRILKAAQDYRPVAVGIEKGSYKAAIMPYLLDRQAQIGIYPNIVELTHGNKKKTERIIWALQGRFEHGRIIFKKGAWNRAMVAQLLDFPNPLSHDDLIDALAYIDQIGQVVYQDLGIVEQDESFTLDDDSGY